MPKSAKRHQDPYRKRKCKLCKLEFFAHHEDY